MSRTLPTRRGAIRGITTTLAIGGYYTVRSRTGRRLAVSARTRRIMQERGLA